MGKMSALTGLENKVFCVNLKYNTEKSIELRANYKSVEPGWHMNKRMWNTVNFEHSELKNITLRDLIDHSYEEVVKSLPKQKQKELFNLS